MASYAELPCLSNFTFLRGASHAEELVARAKELGYAALAITDECSLAGIVRAHVAAKELGLQLIGGSEIRFGEGPGARGGGGDCAAAAAGGGRAGRAKQPGRAPPPAAGGNGRRAHACRRASPH